MTDMNYNATVSNNRIFLVGFMGVGKTTVGKALAERLAFQFIDLDDLIESAAGKTVPQIFSEFGELYFRKLERAMLQSCLTLKKTVIALGGGAFVAAENQKLIKEIGRSIWLECPLEIILSRISFDGSRPLARREDELQKLLTQRQPAYAQADFLVPVGDKSIEQVVDAIINLLN